MNAHHPQPRVGGAKSERAVALILVLLLLVLLVLVVYGLSVLGRIGGRLATSGAYQVQARQNALLALGTGWGELARQTRDPSRLTGMAGITGIAAGASNRTRHWCGVWTQDGNLVTWLVSGAAGQTIPVGQEIELVSDGSVGAATANSEHVIAGKVPVVVSEMPGASGVAATTGHYAYLVLDEGVKLSAYAPGATHAPRVFSTTATSAAAKLATALAAHAARLPRVLAYEQLRLLPTPTDDALTPSILQDNFHHAALTAWSIQSSVPIAGVVNANTNSLLVWRSLLQAYNNTPGITTPLSASAVNARGTAIIAALSTYTGAGKTPGTPFMSTAAVGDFLATIFPPTGTPTAPEIMVALTPVLSVRSDTFRIRAYGDAVNPLAPATIEAMTGCEAVVQRQPGGDWQLIHFRWLSAEDF